MEDVFIYTVLFNFYRWAVSDKANEITNIERKVLGNLIKDRMMALKMDMQYLCQEAQISERTYTQWTTGRTTPDWQKMIKVIKVLYGSYEAFGKDYDAARANFAEPALLAAEKQKTNEYLANAKTKRQAQNRKKNKK